MQVVVSSAVAVIGVLVALGAILFAQLERRGSVRAGRPVRRAYLAVCAAAAVLGFAALVLSTLAVSEAHSGPGLSRDVLALLRLVGFILAGLGIGLLGREQRVTVSAGRPARPWRIAGCIALVPVGAGAVVAAVILGG